MKGMISSTEIKQKILEPGLDFNSAALDVFRFQAAMNPVYRDYISHLRIRVDDVDDISKIPFLPIGFFKSHDIITAGLQPEIIFTSSGTTGQQASRHLVHDVSFYKKVFMAAFKKFYGDVADFCILALLPSYLERSGSSLVCMADELIIQSRHPASGFYLHDLNSLHKQLTALEASRQPVILLGVTYALLDLAEQFPMAMQHTTIMETGGMKGRRKEMLREEVHEILKLAFHVPLIHSEYGMTELLSQAYSKGNGKFECPPWMKILVRDIHDPLGMPEVGKTGVINIIDLANVDSCSFIATEDLGRVHPDGNFEVLGRFDNSDLRGCNLMVE